MNSRTVAALVVVLAQATTATVAMAEVPACPASLGGYVATVHGGSVTVCPTATPVPGMGSATCPFTTGMFRVDMSTGSSEGFLGPCVADPAGGDAGDAGTPCYLDTCVPPGTYEYGYQTPPFAGCNSSCKGPTSGEWATIVTVSSSECAEDAGVSLPSAILPPFWSVLDGAAGDGATVWSGTCTGPLPEPDGGYCAWEWLDGVAQWAPCPPDGGPLCPSYNVVDGDVTPVPCPAPIDAGGANGECCGSASSGGGGTNGSSGGGTFGSGGAGANGSSDGGATGETPGASSGGSGGCSMSQGNGGAAYGILTAFSLAIGWRVQRRRRRARVER